MRTRFKTALRAAAAMAAIFAVMMSIPSAGDLSPAAGSAAPRISGLPPGIEVPRCAAGPIPLRPGERLVYRLTWLGISAGEAILAMGDSHRGSGGSGLMTAQAWAKTTPITDHLFKMRDYMREDLSSEPLRSQTMYINQSENQRRDQYVVSFDHRRHLVTMVKHSNRGSQVKQFRSDNPFGLLSGALMALSQPLQVGRSFTLDIFSGSNRYVLNFRVDGREQVATPIGTFSALRVIPSIVYLSDSAQGSATHATTLWISDDKRRLPLRIESQVFVGAMRADLVQVSGLDLPQSPDAGPSAQEQSGVQLAEPDAIAQ